MALFSKGSGAVDAGDDIYNVALDCAGLFEVLVDDIASGSPGYSSVTTISPPSKSCSTEVHVQGKAQQPIDLVSCEKISSAEVATKIQQISGRFDLWVNYTGALAAEERCLDNRLDPFPDIKEMVVELLQMLRRNIPHLHAGRLDVNTTTIKRPEHDGSMTEQEAWSAATYTLDRLHFLASVIRKASFRSQEHHLSPCFDDKEQVLFEQYATAHVKHNFPNARSSLRNQLGSSIAHRRILFRKKKQREERLRVRRDDERISLLSRQPAVAPQLKQPHELARDPTPSNHIHMLLRKRFNDSSTHTGSLKSVMDGAAARQMIAENRSYAASSSGYPVQDPDVAELYPPVPTFSPGVEEMPCPYCGKLLKSGISESRWRSHFLGDLQPYVCLSEGCISPFRFFAKKREWTQHMRDFHSPEWNRSVHSTSWYCDIDHDITLEFDTREELFDHLKQASSHSRRPKPTDFQLQLLAKAKQRIKLRDQYVCPLCDCVPDKVMHVVSSSTCEKLMEELNDHISQHLLNVAFVSVPWQDTPDAAEQEFPVSNLVGSERTRETFFLEPKDIPTSALFHDPPLVDGNNVVDNIDYMYSGASIALTISDTKDTHWNKVADINPKLEHLRKARDDEDSPLTLGDRFLLCLRRSMFDTKREFLPEGYLDEIVNRKVIQDELFCDKAALDSDDEKLVDFIDNHAKKVFATAYCALTGSEGPLLTTMTYFQSIHFTDESLPIKELRKADPSARNAQPEIPEPFIRNQTRAFRRIWPQMKVRDFYEKQWMFLAPVFCGDRFHHDLSVDVVLPFVWVNNVIKGGRFSKVYEVEIHENHQGQLGLTIDGTAPHVAVKEILTTDNDEELRQEIEKNFNLEADALSDISSLKHNHIIERIAAITIDKRHYFIFQWADGGNLRDFWRDNPLPELTTDLIRQSVIQLRGLADALVSLHHYKDQANYRHGDLKPENVLRFKDRSIVGHLKIADMGLAKRHTEATAARGDPTSTKYGTTRYEPPETSTNRLNARSRLYDVWSLGCIILEYIIWLLHGYRGLVEFSEQIQEDTGCFYLIDRGGDHLGAKVHPKVVAWMDFLGENPECLTQTAIRDLLGLVRDKLLVVALQPRQDTKLTFEATLSVTPADTSDPNPVTSYRARAAAVYSALQEILDLGDGNERYLLVNKGRPLSKRVSVKHDGNVEDVLRVPGPSKAQRETAKGRSTSRQ